MAAEEYTIAVGDRVQMRVDALWCWHEPTIHARTMTARTSFKTHGPLMGGMAMGEVTEYVVPPVDSELPMMLRLTQTDGWEYLVELPDIAEIAPLAVD